jgi:hypothetical protein
MYAINWMDVVDLMGGWMGRVGIIGWTGWDRGDENGFNVWDEWDPMDGRAVCNEWMDGTGSMGWMNGIFVINGVD